MDTNIRVKVMYDDTVYNKWGEIINETYAGEIIDAILNEATEEYFGKDRKGRKVFVGSLDMYGKLVLEPGFKLVNHK
ncbi:hypothetical protein ACO9S3_08070 [Bacillus velezensis]|uniref:hypothetical protein n=1 Tax=Bacillus velezensis TaxID=492670 RepID=UPI0013663E62|nr:hypothetical protein [Bacillus velezensis]MVZ95818.1 hypothetical protein [Bacillus velezensis]UWD95723.1 hypothetical protein NX081_11510 [Bacillus velezensis]